VYRNRNEKAAQDRAVALMRAAGIQPDALTVSVFDPAYILIDALRALGTDATSEQVRAYIANMHGYFGVYGEYDFRDGSQRGLGADDVVIERWDPDKSVFIALSDFGGVPFENRKCRMHILSAKFILRESRRSEFLSLIDPGMFEQVEREPSTLLYLIHADQENPNALWCWMVFRIPRGLRLIRKRARQAHRKPIPRIGGIRRSAALGVHRRQRPAA